MLAATSFSANEDPFRDLQGPDGLNIRPEQTEQLWKQTQPSARHLERRYFRRCYFQRLISELSREASSRSQVTSPSLSGRWSSGLQVFLALRNDP